jgi:hypothetical protein
MRDKAETYRRSIRAPTVNSLPMQVYNLARRCLGQWCQFLAANQRYSQYIMSALIIDLCHGESQNREFYNQISRQRNLPLSLRSDSFSCI